MERMTDEQAADRIRKECSHGDTECAHYDADQILCDILESLGYQETVKEYHAVGKWYA